MAPPVYTPEVGQGQDTSHGPQGRKGSRVRRHPHLALCQGSLGILISGLEAGQPILQLLPGIYAVL
jgi:hypothetical protein